MKKYITISLLFGIALGYLLFLGLDELSSEEKSAEPARYGSDMSHVHSSLEVMSEFIPELSVNVYRDDESGFNIQLMLENFSFAPESVNSESTENQGHAHVYINDEKIARIYSEWFHVDSRYLNNLQNTMRITLNANDHSEWSINNEPIEVRINLEQYENTI